MVAPAAAAAYFRCQPMTVWMPLLVHAWRGERDVLGEIVGLGDVDADEIEVEDWGYSFVAAAVGLKD